MWTAFITIYKVQILITAPSVGSYLYCKFLWRDPSLDKVTMTTTESRFHNSHESHARNKNKCAPRRPSFYLHHQWWFIIATFQSSYSDIGLIIKTWSSVFAVWDPGAASEAESQRLQVWKWNVNNGHNCKLGKKFDVNNGHDCKLGKHCDVNVFIPKFFDPRQKKCWSLHPNLLPPNQVVKQISV